MRKRANTKALKNKQLTSQLIEAIGSKKYSKANKYLMKLVEDRIQQRVSKQLDKPLF